MLIFPVFTVGTPKPPKSLSFQGGGCYLRMSDTNFGAISLSKIAISCWVYPQSGLFEIFKQWDGTASSAYSIKLEGSTVAIRTKHGSSTNEFLGSTTFSINTWYHILIHLDPTNGTSSSRIKVWINGSAETASSSTLANSSSINNSTLDVYWGDSANHLIYQPAIYSGVLPAIGDVYLSGARALDLTYSGLYSYIDTSNDNILDDYFISTNWTDDGAGNDVALSTNIPT